MFSLIVRDKVTRQCPQNDFCIQMGSDESHFNVSLIVKDKVTRLDFFIRTKH